jgi:endogenous inhibitor of DNA gyrase (YacG/DUF329 family)
MDGVGVDRMEAEIFNTLGQKVWNRNLRPVNGSVCETIDLNDFPKGMYYIRIISSEESCYRTVVIE